MRPRSRWELLLHLSRDRSEVIYAPTPPGLERRPLKKLADAEALLKLLHRWRDEAGQAGHTIKRIAVAYEAGRDGFWLARWLQARDIEAYVIHPSSVPVSREHRRAKTDRLDTELLMRAFLGWLRGEKHHCSMAAIPTIEEEDAKRPNREREKLVGDRTRIVNRMRATLARLGIRGFNPTLRKAEEKLAVLQTAEGAPLPENTQAEFRRDMARLRLVREQITAIERRWCTDRDLMTLLALMRSAMRALPGGGRNSGVRIAACGLGRGTRWRLPSAERRRNVPASAARLFPCFARWPSRPGHVYHNPWRPAISADHPC